MKKSVEKIYKNGALSKLGKRAAVMLLCLCLMVSFVQNVAFKATYAETIDGTDVPAAQVEDIAAEEPVAVPEAPAGENAAEEPVVTPEEPEENAGQEPVVTPEESEEPEEDAAEEPMVSSSDDEAAPEKDEAVSESDSEETEEGISELAPVTMLPPMLMFAAAPIADEPLTAESLGLSPQITFTTSKGEGDSLSIIVGSPNSVVYVDFGDGILVEHSVHPDGTQINGTIAGSGAIKVYSAEAINPFYCDAQQVTALNLLNCSALRTLHCNNNSLTTLDLSACGNLEYIICYKNQLTSLDLSANRKIATLHAGGNQMTDLNLDGCTELKSLICYNNQLTELDVSDCTKLITLSCSVNQISELDLSNCADLTSLECAQNNLRYSTVDLAATPEEFSFGDQPEIEIPAEVAADEVIDLSSEHICNGVTTQYTWYADGEEITPKTAKDGKFTFGEDVAGKKLYCQLTNAAFPNSWLRTTETEVAADNIAEGTCGGCSWKIDSNGVLTIYPTNGVSGTLAKNSYNETGFWPWYNYRTYVKSVVIEDGVFANGNTSFLFNGMGNCTSIDLSGLDTSNATDLEKMFNNCSSLTSLDVSGIVTDKVIDMYGMFNGCKSLTSLDVTNFDTSNVTNMNNMFYSCTSLTSVDVTNFDTSNVKNMNYMFYNCKSLTSVDVTNFDTSNVTGISGMFYNCPSLASVDVTNFDTSNVTDMSYMFSGCKSLTSLDVSNFDTSKVTNMSEMFNGCAKLTSLDVTSFDTSNVTDMSYMFNTCQKLTDLDVTKFNTSKVTDMSYMFSGCNELTSLDVSNFDTSKVTNMSDMFAADAKLNTISVSAKFTPASNYERYTNVNFFNVVDGNLIVKPKDGYAVKSITVGGEEVEPEFDEETGTYIYAGFEGDSVATIIYDKGYTVTFMDGETEVEKQTVLQGGNAKDPYADTANRPEKPGYEFIGWDKDITNIQSDLTVNAQWKLDLKPQITFTTSKAVGEKLTVYLETGNSADTVFVDWGDGTLVEYTVTDDLSDNELPSVSAPVAGTGEIKIYSESGIVKFNCDNSKITALNVRNCPSLKSLSCSNNNLTQLDLSNTAITNLGCSYNPLTVLNLSGCSELVNAYCNHAQLSELNLTGCLNLATLDCDDNQLSELDVTDCAELTSLRCKENQLEKLDILANTKLLYLDCSDNNLSEIIMPDHTELNSVLCNNNKLKELDFSDSPALKYLECTDNLLEKLIVSDCPELFRIYCFNNKLETLDASNLPKLEDFQCNDNKLHTLNLTGSSKVAILACSNNQLTELELSDCPNIALFACFENSLRFSTIKFVAEPEYLLTHPQEKVTIPAETAALSGVVDLSSEYDIYGNKTVYTWYDAADDSVVTPKTADGGKFTFDASAVGKSLYCKMQNAYYPDLTLETTETKITFALEPQITFTTDLAVGETLDIEINVVVLRGHPSVIYVDLGDGNPVPYTFDASTYDCKITAPIAGTGEIKIYSEREFKKFICSDNKITSIDVSNCPALDKLTCKNNLLTELDLSNNPELESLDCSENSLDELDVSNNLLLNTLFCTSNNLANLDVSNNLNLKHLYCSSNNLTELDVSNNSLLVTLDCAENQIEELDVSGLTSLRDLWCEYNKITKLTLTNCISLTNFYCDCNELTELDVSDCTKLSSFYCYGNKLTELDVSNNARLSVLDCGNNNIGELDLSNNPWLSVLYCNENNIKELDLSNNPDIGDVYCNDNQLTKLDLNGCEWLYEVACENNKLRFSTMEIPYLPENMQSHPQAVVEIPAETEANVGVVDLSSEYDIYGNITEYKWYDAATNEEVTPKTAEGGKFTFGLDAVGKSLYCKMTNVYYPDLTLTTTATKIFSREFTLYFDVNGGDALPADEQSKTVIYSEPVGALPTPTKAGHTFTGWLDEMSAEYTADTVYMVEGDTTLTAQWKVNKYKVNYHLNEAITEHPTKGILPEGDEVDYNTEYTAKFPAEIDGYTFFGWYTDEGYTAEFVDGTPITEETDLYGHWSRDTITIGGAKTWVENGEGFVRPDSITVNLYQNGTLVDSCVVPKDETANVQFYSFKEMYISDEDSNLYEYTVAEETVPDKYVSVVTGYDITNTFNVNTYTITKQWDNTGNPEDIPESVDVELLCDGTLYKTVTLSEENGWGEVISIPTLDAEGHEFTVRELTVPGYTTEYETTVSEDGVTFTVKNTFEMPKITVGGDVIWENVPKGETVPDMNVNLMLDGAVIDTVTVPAGTESYEFADLDRYDEEGNALAYTVEANALADYETEYSAPATDENGNITVDITNTGIITYGTLTVSNKVTGEGADKTLKFPFKVEIDAAGSFECRIINASSFNAFSLRAAGDVIELKSGDTIELAHGDIAVISGIPNGTAYSVTETDSKGYKVTSTGEKGTVTEAGAEAVFTNEFVTEVEGDSDKPTPPQTGEKDETPKTGDDYNKPLVIGLTAGFALLLAVCIISGVVAKKKRQTKEADESETE